MQLLLGDACLYGEGHCSEDGMVVSSADDALHALMTMDEVSLVACNKPLLLILNTADLMSMEGCCSVLRCDADPTAAQTMCLLLKP